MIQGIAPRIGFTANSPWVYGPKISRVRPTTQDMTKYLDNVALTSNDVIDTTFDTNVPTYKPEALAPPIPGIVTTFKLPQVEIPAVSAKQASGSALLMQKAMAMKAYSE